ncbi:MAG: SBBP repeat-containing protein [Candidatus Kapabacteria bacterium]|nr:SBBP repeat-containing protein [Candidatus Kapabacteria bacterium]
MNTFFSLHKTISSCLWLCFVVVFLLLCKVEAHSQIVSTLAGKGFFNDGAGSVAQFVFPISVAADAVGNVFVADTFNHRIRKITSTGQVTTLAGSGQSGYADGASISAQFYFPTGVAVDAAGNVFVADAGNSRIRKITSAGQVTTLVGLGQSGFADAARTSRQIYFPNGVAVDGSGNVYVADHGNHRILKITSAGVVSTLAGSGQNGYADGTGTAAQFSSPFAVAVDADGSVYVADSYNRRIRKITSAGVVSTLAGSGQSGYADSAGTSAQFYLPYGIAVDAVGNVYVADTDNSRIRKITSAGQVTTLAGSGRNGYADGTGTLAQFSSPAGVALDGSGNVYVADIGNNRIRKITSVGQVTTLAGSGSNGYADGTGTSAQFNNPFGVALDGSGNVYVADLSNQRIRKITSVGQVTTLAGTGQSGYADGMGTSAQFAAPFGVAVDGSGNVYVADRSNHRIRKITSTGQVTTLAGSGKGGYADGAGTSAQFYLPSGVAVDTTGNVYVADSFNYRIRKVTSGGQVTTLAGSAQYGYADGVGTSAQFYQPIGVAVDGAGNVYVADYGSGRIRKITSTGQVTTLAGSGQRGYADGVGTSAQFDTPIGIAVDGSGNVYVADIGNSRIRKITSVGQVTTLAGSGQFGYADGAGASAQFYQPNGVAVDAAGNVYVADTFNQRIRKIVPTSTSIKQDLLPQCRQYPNPFSEQTTLEYDLPTSQYVVVEIVTSLGQRLLMPVSEWQQAGRHSLSVDLSGYSSGMYVMRLQTGAATQSILLRLLR